MTLEDIILFAITYAKTGESYTIEVTEEAVMVTKNAV